MNLKEKIKILKKKNKKIGLIHGVFDVVHYGHIKYFEEAKKKVDYLIVSITSDKYVHKGPGKPIFNTFKRYEVLKSIKEIDEVVISNYPTAIQNIKLIKPHYYIKGKDYKNLSDDLSKNILLEKKEVEKYKGKILFTNSELHSSSSIINKNFDFITEEAQKFIKKSIVEDLGLEFKKLINTISEKKILIIGDPILDIIKNSIPSGKSNKNNIIATRLIGEETSFGGSLLILNFLSQFYKKIDFIFVGNKKDYSLIKKKLNKNINIIHLISENKIIKKNRYVDSYTLERFFQSNENEELKVKKKVESKIISFLSKKISQYHQVLFYDFGYIFSFKKMQSLFLKYNKNLVVNCQSNSYNFGYNLANKYRKSLILSMDESEFRLVVQDKHTDIKKLILKNIPIFRGHKIVIITHGRYGSYVIFKRKIHFVPAILSQRLDSTGAGDIFLSMFAYLFLNSKFTINEISLISHVAAGIHSNQLGSRFNLDKKYIFNVLSSALK